MSLILTITYQWPHRYIILPACERIIIHELRKNNNPFFEMYGVQQKYIADHVKKIAQRQLW